MSISKIISFNTGRQYSESGQRIAAAIAPSGAVIMVDIDRGLEYAIYGIDLDRAAIMDAYDSGAVQNVSEYDFNYLYDFLTITDFLIKLKDRALNFPACVI
jgi:hypothetical protein